MVLDVRSRGEQVEVVLALEALAHDVHVQQPEEAAAEPESERLRRLGLVGQRCIVERQLLQRVAQVRVLVRVDRVEAAEHHRPRLLVPGQRLGRGPGLGRQRVADAQLGHVLDAGDDVADLAGLERLGLDHVGRPEADVVDVRVRAGLHGADRLAAPERAVDHPHVGDHAPVLVEHGVEDQRSRRRRGIALRRRHVPHERLQDVLHSLARLGRDPQDAFGLLADQLADLVCDALRLGARKVDLVHHGDELQPGVHGEVRVRDRLGLDALRRIDHQQRALTCGERPGHLVVEVDVPGGVDQVQLVGLAVPGRVQDPDGLRLDRDAALALEVHRVEHLRPHLQRIHGVGQLEDAVGERRLAVVDVGDDREVANLFHGVIKDRRGLRRNRANWLRTSAAICCASSTRAAKTTAAYAARPAAEATRTSTV